MTAVVHVITTMAGGGAQRVALEIAARLHSEERPQYLLAGVPEDDTGGSRASGTLASGGLVDEARTRLGMRFVRVPSLSNARSPLRDLAALDEIHARLAGIRSSLSRDVRGRRRLIVHTHSIKAGLLGRIAGRAIRDARVVHMLHGFAFDALGGARGRSRVALVERLAAAFGDVQLFVSEADRETARRLRIGRRDDAPADHPAYHLSRIVRAGVDPARFRNAALDELARRRVREELRIPLEAPLAVTVANFKPQKDPLFHVDILAAWRALEPNAQLVFLGAGPLREAAVARARALHVEGALHLPGAVSDPRPFLAAADVMLLASAWEGLPCSVLEGLVAGVPVVVRDTGWGRDLAFAGASLSRVERDATAADVAKALVAARAIPRASVALPAEFTVDGMLAAVSSLYDELTA